MDVLGKGHELKYQPAPLEKYSYLPFISYIQTWRSFLHQQQHTPKQRPAPLKIPTEHTECLTKVFTPLSSRCSQCFNGILVRNCDMEVEWYRVCFQPRSWPELRIKPVKPFALRVYIKSATLDSLQRCLTQVEQSVDRPGTKQVVDRYAQYNVRQEKKQKTPRLKTQYQRSVKTVVCFSSTETVAGRL